MVADQKAACVRAEVDHVIAFSNLVDVVSPKATTSTRQPLSLLLDERDIMPSPEIRSPSRRSARTQSTAADIPVGFLDAGSKTCNSFFLISKPCFSKASKKVFSSLEEQSRRRWHGRAYVQPRLLSTFRN